MNRMPETSNVNCGSVNPLNQSTAMLLPDLKHGGLVAIRAAEGIGEQDGEGDTEAVAAKKRLGVPVFGAAFVGQNRSHAKWTAGPGSKDPL
jgi:hypothetical protein